MSCSPGSPTWDDDVVVNCAALEVACKGKKTSYAWSGLVDGVGNARKA